MVGESAVDAHQCVVVFDEGEVVLCFSVVSGSVYEVDVCAGYHEFMHSARVRDEALGLDAVLGLLCLGICWVCLVVWLGWALMGASFY